jgi:arabinose-5-phosphate isomerase
VPVIALTHDLDSPLAKHAEIVLDGSIEEEACPNGIAPTTSSTVALVIGDALAVALMRRRGFTAEDFARFHPAGALGRKLLLTARDAVPADRELPVVAPDADLAQVILAITQSRCGATLVMDQGILKGLVTDGDLRRHLLDGSGYTHLRAGELMSPSPRTFRGERLAAEALAVLNRHKIQQLVLLDELDRPQALLHLHDLLSQGIR